MEFQLKDLHKVFANGLRSLRVQITGSEMELYATSDETKPDPTTVQKGTTLYEIDTQTFFISDGITWIEEEF